MATRWPLPDLLKYHTGTDLKADYLAKQSVNPPIAIWNINNEKISVGINPTLSPKPIRWSPIRFLLFSSASKNMIRRGIITGLKACEATMIATGFPPKHGIISAQSATAQ